MKRGLVTDQAASLREADDGVTAVDDGRPVLARLLGRGRRRGRAREVAPDWAVVGHAAERVIHAAGGRRNVFYMSFFDAGKEIVALPSNPRVVRSKSWPVEVVVIDEAAFWDLDELLKVRWPRRNGAARSTLGSRLEDLHGGNYAVDSNGAAPWDRRPNGPPARFLFREGAYVFDSNRAKRGSTSPTCPCFPPPSATREGRGGAQTRPELLKRASPKSA